MAPKRDWVDYTNLAANVIQTAKLDGIESKMQEMAHLERVRGYREEQEAEATKREDLLRDMVFSCSEHLRIIEETSSENPAAAYLRASHAKRLYENVPQMKTSGFRKYEDKERLANMQRDYDRFISVNVIRLKPEEVQQCDRCVDHIFNRKELLKLISVQELAEERDCECRALPERQSAKEEELQAVKEEQQRNVAPSWMTTCQEATIVSGVGMAVAVLLLLISGYQICSVDSTAGNGFACGKISFFLGVPSAVIFFLLRRLVSSHTYTIREKELAQKVAAIESEITVMKQSVSINETEAKQHGALYEKYGTSNAEDSRQMLQDRDALLVKLGGDWVKSVVAVEASIPIAFEVSLVGFSKDKFDLTTLLKVLQEVKPGLGFSKAADLVSGAMPCPVTRCDTKEEAEKIGASLEKAGGQIVISKCIG